MTTPISHRKNYVSPFSVSAESSEEMDGIIHSLVTEQVRIPYPFPIILQTQLHKLCGSCIVGGGISGSLICGSLGLRLSVGGSPCSVQEVGELTCLILRELEENYPWMARSTEQVRIF